MAVNHFHLNTSESIRDPLRHQLNIVSSFSNEDPVPSKRDSLWIPSNSTFGTFFRGLLGSEISSYVLILIGAIRDFIRANIKGTPIAILIDTCIRLHRILGLSSLPLLLSRLESRTSLGFLASLDSEDDAFRTKLVLWFFGLFGVSKTILQLCPLWPLFDDLLARVSYHLAAKTFVRNIRGLIGNESPLSIDHTEYLTTVEGERWVLLSIPRATLASNGTLIYATVDISRTKTLLDDIVNVTGGGGSLLTQENIIEDDHDTESSVLLDLIIREIWDASGGRIQIESLTERLIMLAKIVAPNCVVFGDKIQLGRRRYLQLIEMVPYIWTKVSSDYWSGDLPSQVKKCIEPPSIGLPNQPVEIKEYLSSNRVNCDIISSSIEQQVMGARYCTVVTTFLQLLTSGVIYEIEDYNLRRAFPLIYSVVNTLTTNNKEILSPLLRCHSFILNNLPVEVVYNFIPGVLLNFVAAEDESLFCWNKLLAGMKHFESTPNNQEGAFSSLCLSAYCEALHSFNILKRKDRTEVTNLIPIVYSTLNDIIKSDTLIADSKVACLNVVELIFEFLEIHSVMEFQEYGGTPGRSLQIIIQLVTMTDTSTHSSSKLSLAAGRILGYFGAPDILSINQVMPPESRPIPWWDSCCHFLGIRAIECLFYNNINERLSLYCCHQLLEFIEDESSYENCSSHDNSDDGVNVRVFISTKLQGLSSLVKGSTFTASLPPASKDILLSFSLLLVSQLPPEESAVFIRGGIRYSSCRPAVLRFFLPRLILRVLATFGKNDQVGETIGGKINEIFDACISLISVDVTRHETVSLFGPTGTCLILFESLDALRELLETYLNSDGDRLPQLQRGSKTNLQLRQVGGLSLSSTVWSSMRSLLRTATGSVAARAAIKTGSFDRGLFYLESSYAHKIPWQEISEINGAWTIEDEEPFASIIQLYLTSYEGLNELDNVRSLLEITPLNCIAERRALLLTDPMQKSKEYNRLALLNPDQQLYFKDKALSSLKGTENEFLFALHNAPDELLKKWLPTLLTQQWKAGYYDSNFVLQSLAPHLSTGDRCKSYQGLTRWNSDDILEESQIETSPIMNNKSSSAAFFYSSGKATALTQWNLHAIFQSLFKAKITAMQQDVSLSEIKKLLAPVLQCCASLQECCIQSLSKVSTESFEAVYEFLVPLQLSLDLEGILKGKRWDWCQKRIEILRADKPLLLEYYGSLKVAFELLGDWDSLGHASLLFSKLNRKCGNCLVLPGALQLQDIWQKISSSSTDSWLVNELTVELAKTLPKEEQIHLLCNIRTDKSACLLTKIQETTLLFQPHVVEEYERLTTQYSNSERAHSQFAEVLDEIIKGRILKDAATKTPPNDDNESLGTVELVEMSICHHLGAVGCSNGNPSKVRPHLLKFVQLMSDLFFNDEKRLTISSVEAQNQFVSNVARLIDEKRNSISTDRWYLILPQLIARAPHILLGSRIIQPLIASLIKPHASQMAWLLGPLLCSERADRKSVAQNILMLSKVRRGELERAIALQDALITLSSEKVATEATEMNLFSTSPKLIGLIESSRSILLPILSQMDTVISPNAHINISGIGATMIIMKSKQCPKRIVFLGSDGLEYNWLIKREQRGDLRKDVRLMEVALLLNEWIKYKNVNFKLELRRFSVIPLNEYTGLIEWITNLVTLRTAVMDSWDMTIGRQQVREHLLKIQRKYQRHRGNSEASHSDFLECLNTFKPVLTRFLLGCFNTAASWHRSKLLFTDSLASWSVLGYVVGLGDRHGENVLIDKRTGQIIHVDFDCLFSKGLLLPIPEIVPFRLTQNLISVLGLGGAGGRFRTACIITMDILKGKKTDCLAALQSFIFDPSIEWTRLGKNNQDDYIVGGRKAREHLNEVELKLSGWVHLKPKVFHADKDANKWSVINSTSGQIDALIRTAKSSFNLSAMYIGWMAWL